MSEPSKPASEAPVSTPAPKPKLTEKEIIQKAAKQAHKAPAKRNPNPPPSQKKQTPKPVPKNQPPKPSAPSSTATTGYIRKPFLMRRGR